MLNGILAKWDNQVDALLRWGSGGTTLDGILAKWDDQVDSF